MWSCLGWLVGAGRGGCAGCWVVFSVCSSSGCAVRAVPETAWARLPGASAHRRPQLVAVGGLVPEGTGPRLLRRCACVSDRAEVNVLWGG